MITKIYVVEFQKRGLLHAHILIFFTEDYKPHTIKDIDRMISAKLPNSETNELAHETVARCMVHVELRFQMPHAWKKANAKKIPTQVPIQDNNGCKRIPYLKA